MKRGVPHTMTLFKQIAIILSLLLLTILTTVLILNFQSATNSVQERLYEDAQNTAGSLSLSLGSANGDISMMSIMINANFDSGNYQLISLVDVDGNLLYDRKKESKIIGVPEWFINIFDITAPIATANVSAGWSQVGILSVQSDVDYAYNHLYTISKNLLISFSIIAFIGLVLLNLLLVAILKPLKKVQQQAEAVIHNEFIIQEEIPYTKEFKDVVLGMNNMVSKVKAMFEKGNAELKRQKELEYIDPTTKLRNRKYLIDKLPEYLKIDAKAKSGMSLMIALSGVVEANEKIGHRKVDELYRTIAKLFLELTQKYEDVIVARMNGTEFAIFLPGDTQQDALELAQTILTKSKELIQDSGLDTEETFLCLGLYEYNYKESIGELLSRSDNALMQAKLKAWNLHLIQASNATEVMGKDAWRDIINDAIKNNKFAFVSWLVVNTQAKKIAHHVLSLTLKADKKTTYSYAQFMGVANQTGLSDDIYRVVLNQLFTMPNNDLRGKNCSLRLPYDFLLLHTTYDEMKILISKYAKKLPFKLIIEMPDKLVNTRSELIKDYANLFKQYDIKMGIFEFIGDCGDYNYLQEFKPTYIKAESSYYLTQTEQSLSALKLIADAIDIDLIATSVMDEETLKELEGKGIQTIQGRATELINLES
jgi:diguanylate cyclase (GGDEF)-like protein